MTPTLPVRMMAEAITFYKTAGFDVDAYDSGFAFVRYSDASVFDLDSMSGSTQRTTAQAATSSRMTRTSGTRDSQRLDSPSRQ